MNKPNYKTMKARLLGYTKGNEIEGNHFHHTWGYYIVLIMKVIIKSNVQPTSRKTFPINFLKFT